MSNSPFAKERYPAHHNNYWGERGVAVSEIIIHYMYAKWTAKRCCESFQDPTRGASSNYCIGYEGEIAVSVDEALASGCSNSREADSRGVTIEVANDDMKKLTHSEETINSLVILCADIAKRNKLGKLVPGKNLHGTPCMRLPLAPVNFSLREWARLPQDRIKSISPRRTAPLTALMCIEALICL